MLYEIFVDHIVGFGYFSCSGTNFFELGDVREMALESSKRCRLPRNRVRRLNLSERLIVRIFCPSLSATGLYAYMQKRVRSRLTGDICQRSYRVPIGELVYNLYIDPATKLPVMGKDGLPLSAQYAFMPDIELELGLRGVYSAGAMLEQPIYMGWKDSFKPIVWPRSGRKWPS